MAGRRCSQSMKNVRVTKIAVIIEAAMPTISVTAKPFTGPVPNWKRNSAVSTVRDVRVDDRGHRVLEALVDGQAHGLAVQQLLADALEDQHVRVDRDADREHEAGEPRQRERGVEHRRARRA